MQNETRTSAMERTKKSSMKECGNGCCIGIHFHNFVEQVVQDIELVDPEMKLTSTGELLMAVTQGVNYLINKYYCGCDECLEVVHAIDNMDVEGLRPSIFDGVHLGIKRIFEDHATKSSWFDSCPGYWLREMAEQITYCAEDKLNDSEMYYLQHKLLPGLIFWGNTQCHCDWCHETIESFVKTHKEPYDKTKLSDIYN